MGTIWGHARSSPQATRGWGGARGHSLGQDVATGYGDAHPATPLDGNRPRPRRANACPQIRTPKEASNPQGRKIQRNTGQEASGFIFPGL